jgi:hypothetical protein
LAVPDVTTEENFNGSCERDREEGTEESAKKK